jgi:hypothetical protein
MRAPAVDASTNRPRPSSSLYTAATQRVGCRRIARLSWHCARHGHLSKTADGDPLPRRREVLPCIIIWTSLRCCRLMLRRAP